MVPATFLFGVPGGALVAALLNAVFDFCLGCEVYLVGRRVLQGLRPTPNRVA